MDADGTIVLLGRGSKCINSGGEKVYPEEVEQALKTHPAVLDALVAGVPDARFGERVAAVVQLREGGHGVDTAEVAEHCRARRGLQDPAVDRGGADDRALAERQGGLPLGQGDGRAGVRGTHL